MNNTTRKIFLLLLCVFILSPLSGHNFLLNNQTGNVENKNQSVKVLIDETGQLAVDDILKNRDAFRARGLNELYFGFDHSAYWVMITVEPVNSAHKKTDWFLHIDHATLDDVRYYQYQLDDNNKATSLLKKAVSGDSYASKQKDVSYHNPVFSVDTSTNSRSMILLRVKSSSAIVLPLSILSGESLTDKDKEDHFYITLFGGIMLAMLLYHLVVFLITKEVNYFTFAWLLFSYIIHFLTISGFGSYYLWPQRPYLNEPFLELSIFLILVTSVYFFRAMFEVNRVMPLINRLLNIFLISTAIALVSRIFISHSSALIILHIFGVIIWSIEIMMLITGFRKKMTLAWYFLPVIVVGLATYVMHTGYVIFDIEKTPLMKYGALMGTSVTLAIALSLALSEKYSNIKRMILQKEELAKSEERFKQLANATSEGVLLSDDGIIIEANNSLLKMFGYKHTEVIGRPLNAFVADEYKPGVWAFRNKTTSGEPVIVTGIKKNGNEFSIEVSGKMLDYHGKKIRITAVHDISDREKNKRLRSEYERSVRHNLKNPLSVIIGYADLLISNGLDDDAKKKITHIYQQSNEMLDIINFSIKLFDLEEGEYYLENEYIHLGELFNEIEEHIGNLIAIKAVIIQYQNKSSGTIHGDRPLIQSMFNVVFRTLLEAADDNAVLSIQSENEKGQIIMKFTVQGCLTKEQQIEVFDKFATMSTIKTRVNLYNARLIARAHGGDIELKTKEKATLIYVSLNSN